MSKARSNTQVDIIGAARRCTGAEPARAGERDSGGCPFAPSASGNIVTEDLVIMLEAMGLKTGIDIEKLLAVRALVKQALPDEEMYRFTPEAGLPKGFARAG